MSFSEYNGSKAKVLHAIGRFWRNAQENFPKVNKSTQVGALIKSVSLPRPNSGSERLNKTRGPTSSSNRFGLQKFRLPGLDKKRHAELLDSQDTGDDHGSEDEMMPQFSATHNRM